ncbi:hypothetical protein SHV42_09735 [Pseudomonas capeferrum]|uniref:hypothetical protein n=1 Tax=Pseudomonas capeferrum TaxID=1495066 RepID=UPI00397B78FD
MKRRTRSQGTWGVALAIFAPVAIILLVASQYPTMIERRVEARKAQAQARAAQPAPRPAGTTLEIIMPDGKRLQEGESGTLGEALKSR